MISTAVFIFGVACFAGAWAMCFIVAGKVVELKQEQQKTDLLRQEVKELKRQLATLRNSTTSHEQDEARETVTT